MAVQNQMQETLPLGPTWEGFVLWADDFGASLQPLLTQSWIRPLLPLHT